MGPSLLVVDDSKVARMAVTGIVKRLRPDWALLEAPNAEAALALLREQAVDVTLVDVNMPGVNGLDLARDIRAMRPEMPIAIVSANIQDEVAEAARAIDAAFLAKPLTEEAISPFLSGAALRLRRSGAG
jgi:CheY-like chemotaxis protein